MAISYGNLTNYVKQYSQPIISKAILEARTLQFVDIITGVKYAEQINIMDINPFIVQANNPSNQGFFDGGTPILSGKTAVACPLKIQNAFVLEGVSSLESIWYSELMKKGSYVEDAPVFEKAFMNLLGKYTSQVTDLGFWLGSYAPTGANAHSADTAGNTGYLAGCQGVLYNIFNTASSAATTFISYSGAPTVSTIYGIIEAIVGAIPNNMLMLQNISIWCAPQYVDLYKRALIANNNFHYFVQGSEATSDLDIQIPGRSNIHLRGTPGLAAMAVTGSTTGFQGLVCTNDNNLAAVVDLENDYEKTTLWFSNDFDQLRATTKFKIGGIQRIDSQVIVY
jgi:hypothetical protein